MTQPKYAPIPIEDEVRPVAKLDPPRPWRSHRPADFTPKALRPRHGLGVAGPDQGYVLRLARLFEDRLVLSDGEDRASVIQGCAAVALRRAAHFGRAPVAHDLEVAFGLFGFLEPAPEDLVAYRKPRFRGITHDYELARALVDSVPEPSLALSVDKVRASVGDWRSYLGA